MSEGSELGDRHYPRSPRLEQDVFTLTPSGRPDRPDARRVQGRTKSRRAGPDSNPTDDGSEDAMLDAFGGDDD